MCFGMWIASLKHYRRSTFPKQCIPLFTYISRTLGTLALRLGQTQNRKAFPQKPADTRGSTRNQSDHPDSQSRRWWVDRVLGRCQEEICWFSSWMICGVVVRSCFWYWYASKVRRRRVRVKTELIEDKSWGEIMRLVMTEVINRNKVMRALSFVLGRY